MKALDLAHLVIPMMDLFIRFYFKYDPPTPEDEAMILELCDVVFIILFLLLCLSIFINHSVSIQCCGTGSPNRFSCGNLLFTCILCVLHVSA